MVMAGTPFTVRANVLSENWAPLSVARMVKLDDVAPVGVPLISPLVESPIPLGNAPLPGAVA